MGLVKPLCPMGLTLTFFIMIQLVDTMPLVCVEKIRGVYLKSMMTASSNF